MHVHSEVLNGRPFVRMHPCVLVRLYVHYTCDAEPPSRQECTQTLTPSNFSTTPSDGNSNSCVHVTRVNFLIGLSRECQEEGARCPAQGEIHRCRRYTPLQDQPRW